MFISLIRKRRTIRKFINKQIEPEKIDLLIEAALRSPSSFGTQPWEFILIKSRDLIKKLSETKKTGSSALQSATLAIAICADPKKTDIWIEDSSIAAIFIQLAAESLKLGSCWVQIRNRMHDETEKAREYVARILKIPAKLEVECIIAIGYPDDKKPPHKKSELKYGKVNHDFYGNFFSS